MRSRLVALFAVVISANLVAWAIGLALFAGSPLLFGTALLAYGLGLRHAVDADHIAAIDNITRKLMQEGRRPVAVGFVFALGHSTLVLLASIAIAATAAAAAARFDAARGILGVVGTALSALLLLTIGLLNLVILVGVYRSFRRVRRGASCAPEDINVLLAGRGLLARLFRPLFRMVRGGWHIYLIGMLFGLGFDTASEVGLLGVAAAQAVHGIPVWSILVLPGLFAAGMSLVDTVDGVLMLRVYGWAFDKPIRRLFYNLTITLVSVVVALALGCVEGLGLAAGQLGLTGGLWSAVAWLNDSLGAFGYLIIAAFAIAWGGSVAIYRAGGYDRLDARETPVVFCRPGRAAPIGRATAGKWPCRSGSARPRRARISAAG